MSKETKELSAITRSPRELLSKINELVRKVNEQDEEINYLKAAAKIREE